MPEYRRRVAYLHQRPVLFDGSVEDNLRRVFRLRAHRSRRFDRERVLGWLDRLGRDADFLARPASTLSGGEQQLAALLRTLQLGPQVVLLDEATASLDPQAVAAVESLIAAWKAEDSGRATIWTSHDPAQIGRLADRIVALRAGRVVEDRGDAPVGGHPVPVSSEGASG